MKEIMLGYYKIVGEMAEEAAEYISDRESDMISRRAANPYFQEDYFYNMENFFCEAENKYMVKIISVFA